MTQQEQEQEQVSIAETTIDDGNVFQYETIHVPTPDRDIKLKRLIELKAGFEARIQVLIEEASRIRKNSTDAKTDCKRKFYEKKFAKVNKEVRETILAIQQMQYLITKQTGDSNAANSSASATEN